MTLSSHAQPQAWPFLPWFTAVFAGVIAPTLAMLMLINHPAPTPLSDVGGPILAVALMGMGMISAAVSGRLRKGIVLALLTGFGLLLFALFLGVQPLQSPLSIGLAFVIASISFAARGSLFACASSEKGWLIAVAVVGGEAAVVATAAMLPGMLPDWLLALLPAQWASEAVQTALTGAGTGNGIAIHAASSALIALAGTAAATLLVVRLWPRRWPYLIMFTVWLSLSALVYHRPDAPTARADIASFTASSEQATSLSD